ncbi:UNVERIFIED_CONTAM: rRNA-processing endoribonuclease [Siphonaria sp. JEL0065]|nr:rRNA-processing endoribonuclease [Siphonaria sp. JEL0065]
MATLVQQAPVSGPSSKKQKVSTSAGPNPSILRFEGHLHLRQRLLLATLSGRTVRIDKIRQNEDEFPGLADYEVSFLLLLEKVTNGSHLEISYTGSSLLYKPGVITGGKITHDCPNSRAIGYFLEPLISIAPFAKVPFHLTLNGITNDNVDVCVDTLRTVTLPTLKKFLPAIETVNAPLDLKITKRGAPPLGGGQVIFQCPVVKSLKPTMLTDPGLGVKRIRGIAYATRISPQMANRVVDSARSLLSRYIPDVYLYTDVYKGAESGKGPGYGVSLVAETTTGVLYSAECAYQPRKKSTQEVLAEGDNIPELSLDAAGDDQESSAVVGEVVRKIVSTATQDGILGHLQNDYTFPTPEDLGVRAARLLLTEIRKGGCVDGNTQWLAILMLALGPEDVGKVRVGALTPFSIQLLRDLKLFLGVVFKIGEEPQEEATDEEGNRQYTSLKGAVVLTCLGTGYVNVNKNVT